VTGCRQKQITTVKLAKKNRPVAQSGVQECEGNPYRSLGPRGKKA